MNITTSYLISMALNEAYQERQDYPFNLPVVRALDTLAFHPQVTFFIGENGSGKSTLVEALAVALGFNAEGGSRNFNFATRSTHSSLHEGLTVTRGSIRPKDGFFLRAESFYNVATSIDNLAEFGVPPLTAQYGGVSLHQQSHGESFLSLVRHRFRGSGLYIMDEPEAALSITRQMEFLSLLHKIVQQKSQLVIATHSPILLSYPNAVIYHISDDIRKVHYEDTEHYQLTRYFLLNREAVLRELLDV